MHSARVSSCLNLKKVVFFSSHPVALGRCRSTLKYSLGMTAPVTAGRTKNCATDKSSGSDPPQTARVHPVRHQACVRMV